MNNKHIAAILIIAISLCLIQVTLSLKKQTESARTNAEVAAAERNTAENEKTMKEGFLGKTKADTAQLRAYAQLWREHIERTGTEARAKAEFSKMLKRFPLLTQFTTSNMPSAENKDMTWLKSRVGNGIKLEGDYFKVIQLLSAFERELPLSRISTLEIRKGQRKDDVELELQVESPLLPQLPIAAK